MLTSRQHEILIIIKKYIDKNKIAPTIREICEMANLKSSATVHGYIKRLEKQGYIYKKDKSPRSIRIVDKNETGKTL